MLFRKEYGSREAKLSNQKYFQISRQTPIDYSECTSKCSTIAIYFLVLLLSMSAMDHIR